MTNWPSRMTLKGDRSMEPDTATNEFSDEIDAEQLEEVAGGYPFSLLGK